MGGADGAGLGVDERLQVLECLAEVFGVALVEGRGVEVGRLDLGILVDDLVVEGARGLVVAQAAQGALPSFASTLPGWLSRAALNAVSASW